MPNYYFNIFNQQGDLEQLNTEIQRRTRKTSVISQTRFGEPTHTGRKGKGAFTGAR